MITEDKNIQGRLQDIYTNCSTALSKFEIWPGYYKLRYQEFVKYAALFPKESFDNTLEIGCGIGYQAAFLSCVSKKVTASDVDFGDMIQHSRGLSIARDFIGQTGIENIDIANADAENLPFADEQFDFVFCSYSFQYIPNKDKALQEIKRVLKKDGYFFCILPTTVNRLKATRNYYKAVIKKLLSIFKRKEKKNNFTEVTTTATSIKKKRTKLLPPPDNDSNNYFNELFLYRPSTWQQLFKRNGYQIVTKKYAAFKNAAEPAPFFEKIVEKLHSDGVILITKKAN